MSIAAKWAALQPASKATLILGPLSVAPFLLLRAEGYGFAHGAVFGAAYCLAHTVLMDWFADAEDGE